MRIAPCNEVIAPMPFPRQCEQRFASLFAAPFDYVPDGPAAAARAIGYIRGILETL